MGLTEVFAKFLRTRTGLIAFLAALIVGALVVPSCGATNPGNNPPPAGRWTLLWSDDVSGSNGSAPDSNKWGWKPGDGWRNNELKYYTVRPQNVYQEIGPPGPPVYHNP